MEGVINRIARLARLGYFCCLGLVILAIFTINPVSISGDEANATTGTATSANTSLSLTTNHDNAVVTITPNSANGTFAMSSAAGEAQFGVTTNNFTGYELSIVADDDNGNLVNIDNGITHTISSIPSSITKSSFDTTTYNNKWGYKPNKYLGPNSTIVTNTGDSALFLPSPTTAGTILDHTTVANSSANNYSIALGVRADYNTYAGSYTKNFTLAAIANPTTYIIGYNKNTSDTVTNMPAAQSSATSATSITLASNTPERENYNFLGWCTVQTADNTCSGTTYQPGDTYGIDQTAANTVTLYAMWETSALIMQDMTLDACPTEPTEVVDSRDGEVYTIQKLADGKCWLLDNLRLDLVNVPLTDLQGKTNAEDTTLYYLKNGGGTTSDKYATAGVQEWANSSFASSGSYSDPLIAASGSCYSSGDCVNDPSSGKWTKDSLRSYGDGQNKIGIYYNFCAASAGSYCYGNGTSYGSPSGDATEDICPAGWRMPTGGATGEYQTLYTASSSLFDTFKRALRTATSGYIYNGLANGQYKYGRGNFWASTYSTYHPNEYMTLLVVDYNYSRVYPDGGDVRSGGLSVRCILDPVTTVSIYYDKNTSSFVSNMPASQTVKLNSVSKPTLSSTVPDRTGYVFMGWCNTHPSTLNNIDLCYGDTFSPSGEYTDKSTSSVTLYAIWALRSSIPAMQSITSETCPTVPFPVYDTRDNEIYTIQKLADGGCWLLDNLRLDLSSTRNLTTANTNISSNWTAPTDVANFSNTYTEAKIYTELKDVRQQGNKIGIYYNYCAASAGTYCLSSGTGNNAKSDICPKGWHMPTASNGDYSALFLAYDYSPSDIIKILRAPFSGYHAGSSNYTPTKAYFLSSTFYETSKMQGAEISSTSAAISYVDRNYGYPIRCILSLPKLQEVTASNFESLAPNNGNIVRLIDSRDGDEYKVGKLADGNYWLLENLRLGSTSAITLTPSDTNVQNSWTLPASVSSPSNFESSYTTGIIYSSSKNYTYSDSYFDTTARRGVYYNYCAASGGTICYEYQSDIKQRNPYDAAYDVCPKGWHMPTKMEYENLFANYSDRQSIISALKVPGSGMIYSKNQASIGQSFYGLTSSLLPEYGAPANAIIGKSSYSVGSEWASFVSGFPIRCIFGPGKTMQNITNAELAELLPNAGDIVTLRDSRDGDIYRIGKMSDGRYWMLDNLRIGGNSPITLTSEDTNITSSWVLPASVNSGFTNDDSGRTVARINVDSKNTLYRYGYQSYQQEGLGKIGVYYNYCAASAGTVCAVSNTINASVDVCPKGWRLPTGGPGGEYESLYASYNNNNYSLIPAFKLIRAGGYYDSAVTNFETTGFYLTSTRYDNDTMYRLWVGEANQAEPANIYGHRRPGYSIRCIRK